MSEFYCFQCNEKLPEPITPTDISIWVGTGLCRSCVTKQQQEDLGEIFNSIGKARDGHTPYEDDEQPMEGEE